MTPTRTALQVDVHEAAPVLRAVAAAGLAEVTLLGPPHVSLGHPWVDGPARADHVPALERALAGLAALTGRPRAGRAGRPGAGAQAAALVMPHQRASAPVQRSST